MAKKTVKKKYVWLICYVDSEQVKNLERDLNKNENYKDIKTYIPMVKVLSKQFKGKAIYDEVPLLFNYGFFRIPLKNACNREFLNRMKEDIGCIYAWVKDNMDRKIRYKKVPFAIARKKEVIAMLKSQANYSIYSSKDLDRVKVGDLITLRGYPFDNISAEVKSINQKKQQVRVSLQLDSVMKLVDVSFENVFYSIYQGGYDDNVFSEKSLDEMKERNNGALDKIFASLTCD